MLSNAARPRNGARMMNVDKHLGQPPHQLSVFRPRLQLRNTEWNAVRSLKHCAIRSSLNGRNKLK